MCWNPNSDHLKNKPAIRTRIHRIIFLSSLCLLGIAMTTSAFAANFFYFVLSVNWIAEWNWREKFEHFRSRRLLHAFLILVAMHLIWLVGTSNFAYALHDLQVKLPLLAVPLIVLTSQPLSNKQRWIIGSFYVTTVFVVSIIGIVRYITIPNLPYRSIVPYISHIRFALNVCLSLVFIGYAAIHLWQSTPRQRWIWTPVAILLTIWLLYFLTILQSYTSVAVLLTLLIAIGVWTVAKSTKRWHKVTALTLAIVVIVGSTIAITTIVGDYYRPTALESAPLATHTAQGNAYSHACDGLIENGGQVSNYVCENELRQAWPLVSQMGIDDTTPIGYPVYPTLIRYLGSRGLTKDAQGVMSLTPADINAIERGVSNHVYIDGSTPRQMIYRLLFEYENYRIYGSVDNSSLGERLLLWQSGWQVFCQHPILGVAPGDVPDLCHEQIAENYPSMAQTHKHLHNQYLSFLVGFGIVGFLVIVLAFVRALCGQIRFGRHMALPLLLYIVIVLVSFIAEDTLETLAGILFCTFPIALFRKED